jgi:hypothetical protein
MVVVERGELSFQLCGHHYRANEVSLMTEGWTVKADHRDSPN